MFQNWGFLLGEIWGLVLLAALLGLFCGWLIWSRRKDYVLLQGQLEARERELAAARRDLTDVRSDYDTQVARLATVENERLSLVSARDASLQDLEERGARIVALEDQLGEQEAAAATWQSERSAWLAQRESLEADLSNRDAQIIDITSKLSSAEGRLGDVAALEEARDAALVARSKAESAHAEEIFRLRKADEERGRLRKELAAAATGGAAVSALEAELAQTRTAAAEAGDLKARLAAAEAALAAKDKDIAQLKSQAAATGRTSDAASAAKISEMQTALARCRDTVASRDAAINDLKSQMDDAVKDYDGDGILEGRNEGTKPQTLISARGGKADDLKKIKGVGPKLEGLLHRLGFFHFDQIAGWSRDEVAWVDANLEGFNGRVTRDRWIEQARVLAAGGTTEFAARVEDGGVYE